MVSGFGDVDLIADIAGAVPHSLLPFPVAVLGVELLRHYREQLRVTVINRYAYLEIPVRQEVE